jgi:nicotinamide-nucleotide adenylyltransferase
MNALFLGRFQPFHKGHLFVCTTIAQDYDQLIIGVGSSQYHHTLENPFNYEERKEMISRALTEASISLFHIHAIPDIHDPPHWVEHVITLIPPVDVVITNNSHTKDLFVQKGYEVRQPPFYQRSRLSGHHIRSSIINREPWEDLVPAAVLSYIKELEGVRRIRNLASSD